MMVRAQPRRPKFAKEIVKSGRRRDGGIHVLADGREVYCAFRKMPELTRGNEKNISDALRKRVAAWTIDDDTLRYVRPRGIEVIVVDVEDTGDKFITKRSGVMTVETTCCWRAPNEFYVSSTGVRMVFVFFYNFVGNCSHTPCKKLIFNSMTRC
ncbi:hypothetical protein [Rhizobium sp. RAF56]|uniref:hypothetical protein n=1 Tax=Rhizobium sp. RAF56 TaxID=3233062 RepID=UPI003F976953